MRGAVLFLRLLVASMLVAAPATAGAQARSEGPPWSASAEETAVGARVLELLNAARAELGVPQLIAHPNLDLVAYQHAADMASRGSVSHHSHTFSLSTASRVKLAFPAVRQFGENVARNRDAEALHEALQASAGHRLNRLDPSFTHVGIGAARAGPYEVYLTELFVRVGDPEVLAQVDVLYSEDSATAVGRDDPTHGEIVGETYRVGAPGEDDPAYWTQEGIRAYVEGRYQEAVRHFRTALRLQPDYEEARFDLGRALVATGDGAEALKVLQLYVRLVPDDLDAWASLGAAALLAQEYERAEEAFRNVLSDRARDAGAWYNLGLALEMQGLLEDADRAYAQALHHDPTMEHAAFARARVRQRFPS